MEMKVNYNELASNYNLRYKTNPMLGISRALHGLISENNSKNILEIGCGTGYWLNELNSCDLKTFGIDYSLGMLKEAKRYNDKIKFISADANFLPFTDEKFDLIYCVNAIHQFENKKEFIHNSIRLLKPNGLLAVIGLDPRSEDYKWYIYEYFNGILEQDLKRFPSFNDLKRWMKEFGMNEIHFNLVEEIKNDRNADDVISDPFLQKQQSSQLASLSEHEYSTGIKRIKKAIENNRETIFPVRMQFISISGRKI